MFRIGHGYDIHAFAKNRKLILGGVEIPSELGLLGYSDADVVIHSVMDSMLGALALPDIGNYFPNTDLKWKDVSSLILLKEVSSIISSKGFEVSNIDISIIAEKPKIASHVPTMKEAIAKTLSISSDQVGIKATTNEGLGSLGKGEGIASFAVVLLSSK